MKISRKQKEDFEFYLHCSKTLCCLGDSIVQSIFEDVNGFSPIESFVSFDCTGKYLPCNDIKTLNKAINGKRNINLQIKIWAEGMADCVLLKSELREKCIKGLPDWVEDAILNQAQKIFFKKEGWIPAFLSKKDVKILPFETVNPLCIIFREMRKEMAELFEI